MSHRSASWVLGLSLSCLGILWGCNTPSPAPNTQSPLVAEFSDQALTAGSDLSVHLNSGQGPGRRLRTIELRCTGGDVSAVFKDAGTAKTARREVVLSTVDYLRVWKGLRTTGLLDQLMAGASFAAGTDVYFSGHVGSELGLGFTVSVGSKTAGTHAGIAALVKAMLALEAQAVAGIVPPASPEAAPSQP